MSKVETIAQHLYAVINTAGKSLHDKVLDFMELMANEGGNVIFADSDITQVKEILSSYNQTRTNLEEHSKKLEEIYFPIQQTNSLYEYYDNDTLDMKQPKQPSPRPSWADLVVKTN